MVRKSNAAAAQPTNAAIEAAAEHLASGLNFPVEYLPEGVTVNTFTIPASQDSAIKGVDKASKFILNACAAIRDYLHVEYVHEATALDLAWRAHAVVSGLDYAQYTEVKNAFKHEQRKFWFAVYKEEPLANTITKRWSRFVARVKEVDENWTPPVSTSDEATRKRAERGSNAGTGEPTVAEKQKSKTAIVATIKSQADEEALRYFEWVTSNKAARDLFVAWAQKQEALAKSAA